VSPDIVHSHELCRTTESSLPLSLSKAAQKLRSPTIGVTYRWVHTLVTLRYNSKLHHIGIGRAHKGERIRLLIHDRDIRIINTRTGELLRELTLDPNIDYQP
jgi:hypothetical protein